MVKELSLVGVVEDEVGEPANDGTRGSGLYAVPVRLSRRPTHREAELLVRYWDNPPRFGNMHQAGIATISGDRIVLNSTIEEVRDYHKDTLKLVVAAVNEEEARLRRVDQAASRADMAKHEAHREKVEKIAREIRFDD